MEIKRRTFLKGVAAAGAACVFPKKESKATVSGDAYATLVDLTKCDGCADRETPICVSACRNINAHKFPEPDESMLKDYWPQKKHEDWSKKRHLINRLTPYNWIFVQKVSIELKGKAITQHIPRRCMHCDNPPCAQLCPFGSMKKTKEGPVYVATYSCFGGAKCRAVCPWSVPQRQAGVGFYTYLDPMPVGGGVMYKCDLCRDRLAKGKKPGCVEQCPHKAMSIGSRAEIFAKAEELAKEYNGYLYGNSQNGGTSTLYISQISFEKINRAIRAQAKNPQKAMSMHNPPNMMEKHADWTTLSLLAPVAGAVGAFAATISKKEKKNEG